MRGRSPRRRGSRAWARANSARCGPRISRGSRTAGVRGPGAKGLKRDARSRLSKHVLSRKTLAAKPLSALTTNDLSNWREELQMAAGTVQRTANDFKAALNAAARRDKAQLPATIRDIIKDGLATRHFAPAVAREAQSLPDGDVRAIVSAAWEFDAERGWEGDLGRLVVTLAATGARFSQIARMMVADVQAPQMRLMIPVSRKGGGRKTPPMLAFASATMFSPRSPRRRLAAKGTSLFLRPRWRQLSAITWEKIDRWPWNSSSELIRPWAAIVVKAGLPAGTVPYALRHSSIVRGLRAGLPVRLVAALHDTSSAMIERHYAAFIVDAMDELAARAVVPLTTMAATVTPISRTREA